MILKVDIYTYLELSAKNSTDASLEDIGAIFCRQPIFAMVG